MPQSDPGEGSYRLARWSKTPGSGRPKTDPGEGSNKIAFVKHRGLGVDGLGNGRRNGPLEELGCGFPEPAKRLRHGIGSELIDVSTYRLIDRTTYRLGPESSTPFGVREMWGALSSVVAHACPPAMFGKP